MLTVEHLAAMTANLGDIEHPKHTAQLRWVSCAARAQPARQVLIFANMSRFSESPS
jgi:hypothetical protein